MNKPKTYNLTPARGQALLNFQGRIYPKTVELFETEVIEEVRQDKKQPTSNHQSELNSDFRNLLIQGDCLSTCAYLKSKDIKVDLVYIDPPFASGANYAKTIYLRNTSKDEIKSDDVTIGEEIMYGDIWQKEDYLNWLYERLLAIRDVMSEKASIYIHLDWHIGHYVKLLLDEIFGEENFKNEIVWCYLINKGNFTDKYPPRHDTIFFYSKSNINDFYREAVRMAPSEATLKRWESYSDKDGKVPYEKLTPGMKKVAGEGKKPYLLRGGIQVDWITNIPAINSGNSKEKSDYNTQKPEKLIELFLKASSEKGMIVADFFSGSGTTAKVAHDLGRKFISCDIGINAIHTTRDRLIKTGAYFDILKVKDGVRLFRNPVQTTAKIFSLIDGFKTRAELELGEFWDGGIIDEKGEYIPVKFIEIHDRLTKELLDVILEEIYQLQDVEGSISKVKVIYAHKDPIIDQSYLNKTIKVEGKTNIAVELVSLDDLLVEKADNLFMPDNAEVEVIKTKSGCQVKIKRFFSPYLNAKMKEFNSKKIKNGQIDMNDKNNSNKEIAISEHGLELIESVQFDTTLNKSGVWKSNISLENKAGVKEKIKGVYQLLVKNFKMKIRNIAGDEIIIDYLN